MNDELSFVHRGFSQVSRTNPLFEFIPTPNAPEPDNLISQLLLT